MRLIWVLVLLVGFYPIVRAQLTPHYLVADTIKYEYRTGGSTDSVDYALGRLLGTTPSGGLEFPSAVATSDFFFKYRNGNRFASLNQTLTPKFSGLPHVGMAYTFGGAGTSVAKLNYQQVFAKQILVNLQFKNDRGNSQLRNGVYRMNEVDLLVLRQGKIWSTELLFSDHVNQSNLNNGLDSSADLSLFALKFQAVERSNAQSKFRKTALRWKNYFNVVRFDSLTKLGIVVENRLVVTSRSYSETDSLEKFYTLMQYSPTETNDSYRWLQTGHQVGVYFRSKRFFAAVKGEGVYWEYKNQGMRATVETYLLGEVKANFNGWNLYADGRLNFLEAGQGWELKGGVAKKWNRLSYALATTVENKWMDPFLRYYSANNYEYNNYSVIEKQFFTSVSNKLSYQVKDDLLLGLGVDNILWSNNFFFDGTNWNSHLAISDGAVHQLKFRGSWSPSVLIIQPEYSYSITDEINYVPEHHAKLRLMVKGRLFKAKKLLAWLGADAHYFSSTYLMRFNPAMDTYSFPGFTTQGGMVNLHVFAGLQIDEFRFFVRYENLGYLWNNHSTELLENYPIAGGMLQVGLTWDFFN